MTSSRIFFLALLLSAPGSLSQAATDQSLQLRALIERGSLKVLMRSDEQFPFFFRTKNGEQKGIDIDIVTDIAKILGVKLEIKNDALNSQELISRISRGEADLGVSALSTDLNWSTKVVFSDSYLNLNKALMLNRIERAKQEKNLNPVHTFAKSTPKTIGVLAGSAYQNFAINIFESAKIIPYRSEEALFSDVVNGNISSALSSSLAIESWFKINPKDAIRAETQILKQHEDTLVFALHPTSIHLLHWMNLYIRNKSKSGALNQMFSRYLNMEPQK
jgi:polar amino acid transport system substrate-binding protein